MQNNLNDGSKHEPLLNSNDVTTNLTLCTKDEYINLKTEAPSSLQTESSHNKKTCDEEEFIDSQRSCIRKLVDSGSSFLNDDNVNPDYSIKCFFKFAPVF